MTKKTVVVTGGAGYIGRCTAAVLVERGFTPVVIDNFSTGRRASVGQLTCLDIDLADRKATADAFQRIPSPIAVIHFAAKALVGESVEKPEEYFRNNVMSTLNVLEACSTTGAALVHSSSCAVYGVPSRVPITEDLPYAPISPYGASKVMAEEMILQYVRHRGVRALNLRYFNPAGSLDGEYGESHEPETHLVPCVVAAGLAGRPVNIFGDDYETPDGTCVRDFIHIADLVDAHLAAMERLGTPALEDTLAVNLGLGKGTSVKEVIAAASKVLGKQIAVEVAARRPGDPPRLVADISLARKVLGWEPKRGIEEMIRDHVKWAQGKGRLAGR